MAGSGPNCRFIYVYPGRTNTWLGIIACLRLLVYNLLYGFAGSSSLLNLVNSIVCNLALNSLVLESAGDRPNISLFLLFWRIFAVFINCNILYIKSGRDILLNTIFEL